MSGITYIFDVNLFSAKRRNIHCLKKRKRIGNPRLQPAMTHKGKTSRILIPLTLMDMIGPIPLSVNTDWIRNLGTHPHKGDLIHSRIVAVISKIHIYLTIPSLNRSPIHMPKHHSIPMKSTDSIPRNVAVTIRRMFHPTILPITILPITIHPIVPIHLTVRHTDLTLHIIHPIHIAADPESFSSRFKPGAFFRFTLPVARKQERFGFENQLPDNTFRQPGYWAPYNELPDRNSGIDAPKDV